MFDRQSNAPTLAVRSCSWLILLGGVLTIGVTAYLVRVSYSGLPFSDTWIELNAAIDGTRLLSPSWIFAQHNEHRIVLPKLILAADILWFHGRCVLPLLSIFAIQFLSLACLSWSLRALGKWRRELWMTGTGLAAFCFFCPAQWENFVWEFQTCFVLPGFCAVVSIAALLWYSERKGPRSWWLIAASMTAALAGQYSLSNGVLLWPLLLLAVILLGLGARIALAYLTAAVVSTCGFFYRYTAPSQTIEELGTLQGMRKAAGFCLACLGGAWTTKPAAAECTGLLALVLVMAVCIHLWRKDGRPRGLTLFLMLLILFCLGTSLLTAAGRFNLGIGQAFVSRYQTPVLLFWCSLGLLILAAVQSLDRRRAGLLLFQLVVVLVMLRGADLARYPIRNARWHGFQLKAAAAALVTGAADERQLYYGAVDPSRLAEKIHYLRQNQLSVFAGERSKLLGQPFADHFRVLPSSGCTGAIQSLEGLPASQGGSAVRIDGWVWDYRRREVPPYVIAVQNGTIVGLGATGDWRPSVRASRKYMSTSFIGFRAYLTPGAEEKPAALYAISPAAPARACQIAIVNYSDVK